MRMVGIRLDRINCVVCWIVFKRDGVIAYKIIKTFGFVNDYILNHGNDRGRRSMNKWNRLRVGLWNIYRKFLNIRG